MTKCYGIWYGGPSYYAAPSIRRIEEFDSYADAERCLRSRAQNGLIAKQHFKFVNQAHEHWYCPTVDREASCIYIYDDIEGGYPERIIRFGPRGGIKVER